MKKIALICFASLFIIQAKANVITVFVTDNQFTPANFNCTIGDTIRYSCSQGFHNVSTLTRTGANGIPFSGLVPAGAPPIFNGNPLNITWGYDYVVLVPGDYRYYCQVHTSNGVDGHVGYFTASNPLPAELKNFEARYINKSVATSWQTLTEQNVNYFSVRRSFNGIEFSEIGRVKAAGNSTALQSYRFADNTVGSTSQYIYYSLATIDFDGKQSLSPIVSVKNPGVAKKLISSISPNPVTRQGQLLVQFNADNAVKINAAVFNALGTKVADNVLNGAAGTNNVRLQVGNLPPGIYNIVFTTGQQQESHRVVIQ